jgi:hypothetical protein
MAARADRAYLFYKRQPIFTKPTIRWGERSMDGIKFAFQAVYSTFPAFSNHRHFVMIPPWLLSVLTDLPTLVTWRPVSVRYHYPFAMFGTKVRRRSQVAKAADCKSAIVGPTPTGASPPGFIRQPGTQRDRERQKPVMNGLFAFLANGWCESAKTPRRDTAMSAREPRNGPRARPPCSTGSRTGAAEPQETVCRRNAP